MNRLGSLPNGRALPACPADLFGTGMLLGRWQMKTEQSVSPTAVSARQYLMDYWIRLDLGECLRLSTVPPLNHSPKQTVRELGENLEAVNLHVARCRRIASYLGQELT